ncbi:unnamed protein product, partial [Allacma fusca]
ATVAKQSQDLAKKLKEVTSDVRFGFGSFVDKPVMPFASSAQIHLPKGDVVAPYSFKNHLKLTSDTAAFAREVQQAKNSSNLDEPEGSLDAIMQVIACQSEIGWREDARKLLIMSTDGPFHIAGDGKLAGIVIPNDMLCHLDNNSYTHEKILDYPSIGQLNAKVKETQINVIFAVAVNQKLLYEKLSSRIIGSKTVTLESDSSNVVEVIRTEYQKLKATLELNQDPEKTDDLKITYTYSCDGDGKVVSHEYDSLKKPKCTIKKPQQKLEFDITVELLEQACVGPTPFESKEIKIYPFSLGNETLTLNIKAICDCPCNSQDVKVSDEKCNKAGDLTCGVCKCDEKHGGKKCECDATRNAQVGDAGCVDPDTGIVCSNKGKCVCGKCECDKDKDNYKEVYDGDKCQYDRRKCRAPGSRDICSGHGVCDKEKCGCNEGYDGTYCNCVSNYDGNCKEPGTTERCNGRGSCECGSETPDKIIFKKCECQKELSYGGAYCHTCEGCTSEGAVCGDTFIEDCIGCLDRLKALEEIPKENTLQAATLNVVNQIGGHLTSPETPTGCEQVCSKSKTSKNVTFQLTIADSFEGDSSVGPSSQKFVFCEHQNEDKCKINYRYFYHTEQGQSTYLRAEVIRKRNEDCPKTPWWIIGVVVGSILLIGILLLLIWKIITHIHDTREYQRFEKEREGTKWGGGDNPLYTGPTSQFLNPLRNRRSQMPSATVAHLSLLFQFLRNMGGKKGNTRDQRGSVVNHNYSQKSYKKEGYKSFEEFYPFYLGEHCNVTNRRLHLLATTNVVLILIWIAFTGNSYLLPVAVIQGYALAWFGHFFFEGNKPATFKHPFYSLMGDWRMWFEVATGLSSKIGRYSKQAFHLF